MSVQLFLVLALFVVNQARADVPFTCIADTGTSWIQGNLRIDDSPTYPDGNFGAEILATVSLVNQLGEVLYLGQIDLIGILSPAGPVEPERFFSGNNPASNILADDQSPMTFLYFDHSSTSLLFTLSPGSSAETTSEKMRCVEIAEGEHL